jgi:hypothetical protein
MHSFEDGGESKVVGYDQVSIFSYRLDPRSFKAMNHDIQTAIAINIDPKPSFNRNDDHNPGYHSNQDDKEDSTSSSLKTSGGVVPPSQLVTEAQQLKRRCEDLLDGLDGFQKFDSNAKGKGGKGKGGGGAGGRVEGLGRFR